MCHEVPTGDDAVLATDVWLPDDAGPFPVLLTRTPYHRVGLTGLARRYTDWGYACVGQDCRGKYDSTGTFRPLLDEAEDGVATLDWIANQSRCNGRIGMVGLSYLGMVQIPAAASGHEALRCISPAMAPNSHFTDWVRYDGCFSLANLIRWPMTHTVCATKPATVHFEWNELYRRETLQDVFDRAGYCAPLIREWAQRDRYDEYWERIDQTKMYSSVEVPGFHLGGWFDHISRGQFQAYCGIRDEGATQRARSAQRLLVGAWGHNSVGETKYGEWEFGRRARFDRLRTERRFLDLWLKDIDDGISEEPPVRLFLMGENRWMNLRDWPPPAARTERWHLDSRGDARTLGGSGRLTREGPPAARSDSYRYDPKDPVPTLGGPIYWGIDDTGPADQRPILDRPDVLYYRSDPLRGPLAVVGELNLELWVATEASDTDFIAKLCVVEPCGRITCLALGSLRCRYRNGWDRREPMEPGEPAKLNVRMGHLAYVFPADSRIVLIVTSSSHPRILPHPNTMARPWEPGPAESTTSSVLHGPDHPSSLELPVIDL